MKVNSGFQLQVVLVDECTKCFQLQHYAIYAIQVFSIALTVDTFQQNLQNFPSATAQGRIQVLLYE